MLHRLLPDPEMVVALEPEQLAGFLLQVLATVKPYDNSMLHAGNFTHSDGGLSSYPRGKHQALTAAILEAWNYLVSQVFSPPPRSGPRVGTSYSPGQGRCHPRRLCGFGRPPSYLASSCTLRYERRSGTCLCIAITTPPSSRPSRGRSGGTLRWGFQTPTSVSR